MAHANLLLARRLAELPVHQLFHELHAFEFHELLVLLQPAIERPAIEMQEVRGARLVSVEQLEDAQDVATLDLREREDLRGLVRADDEALHHRPGNRY